MGIDAVSCEATVIHIGDGVGTKPQNEFRASVLHSNPVSAVRGFSGSPSAHPQVFGNPDAARFLSSALAVGSMTVDGKVSGG